MSIQRTRGFRIGDPTENGWVVPKFNYYGDYGSDDHRRTPQVNYVDDIYSEYRDPQSAEPSNRGPVETAHWSIAEIGFVHTSHGFAFEVVARDGYLKSDTLVVDRSRPEWHPIEPVSIPIVPTRYMKSDLLEPAIRQIENQMLKDEWQVLAAHGTSWFSKRYRKLRS